MKKKLHIILFLTLLAYTNISAERGDLVSESLTITYPIEELNQFWPLLGIALESEVPCANWNLEATYGVELYKITYETVNVFGETTTASGLVGLPIGTDCNLPIAQYNHGTKNGGTVSDDPITFQELVQTQDFNEWVISIPVATSGFVAVFPDYIGYGESACTDRHAYNHYSQAKDCVDMIRATKQLCVNKGIGLSEELFITGYSEGGYVAMATAKEIQEHHCDEMHVTAAAPLSGAHSVYPLSRDSLLAPSYNNMSNLTYFLYSANNLCPNILGEEGLSLAIQDEYVEDILASWDECGDGGGNLLPNVSPASGILKQEYVNDVIENSCHPFNEFLRRSNVNNWVPQMPMRLYYVISDEQVPYTNSITTAAWMAEQGADVTALTIQQCEEDMINHSSFAVPSLLETMNWFLSIKSDECDFVQGTDLYECSAAPAAQTLCPTYDDTEFTEFINFALDDEDNAIFELLDYNGECKIVIENTIDTTYTGEVIEYFDEAGNLESTDSSLVIITVDTTFGELPITTDDYELAYVDGADFNFVETILGVNELVAANLSIALQANPVNNQLVLEIDNQSTLQTADIVVYDIAGRKLLNDQIRLNESTQYQREVSDLSMGMYLLQIQLPNGHSETIRFMKN